MKHRQIISSQSDFLFLHPGDTSMNTQADYIIESKEKIPKKKLGWDKRLNLLIAGIILASGIKLVVDIVFPAPLPPEDYPGIGGQFTLQSTSGPVTEEILLGKVSVIFFGYTHCPDICPTTMRKISASLRMLTETKDIKNAQGIFVTVDPERDSAEHVSEYTSYFHNKVMGLSGSEQQIKNIADKYKFGYQKDPVSEEGEYSMSHSSYIYIIRPDGKIGKMFSHSSTPKEIVEEVQKWIPWT